MMEGFVVYLKVDRNEEEAFLDEPRTVFLKAGGLKVYLYEDSDSESYMDSVLMRNCRVGADKFRHTFFVLDDVSTGLQHSFQTSSRASRDAWVRVLSEFAAVQGSGSAPSSSAPAHPKGGVEVTRLAKSRIALDAEWEAAYDSFMEDPRLDPSVPYVQLACTSPILATFENLWVSFSLPMTWTVQDYCPHPNAVTASVEFLDIAVVFELNLSRDGFATDRDFMEYTKEEFIKDHALSEEERKGLTVDEVELAQNPYVRIRCIRDKKCTGLENSLTVCLLSSLGPDRSLYTNLLFSCPTTLHEPLQDSFTVIVESVHWKDFDMEEEEAPAAASSASAQKDLPSGLRKRGNSIFRPMALSADLTAKSSGDMIKTKKR